jgi:hypothetical protein
MFDIKYKDDKMGLIEIIIFVIIIVLSLKFLSRLLCFFGMHDFDIKRHKETSYGKIYDREKECSTCGYINNK